MMDSKAAMAMTFFGATASIVWAGVVAWIFWLKHRFDEPRAHLADDVRDDRIARLEATIEVLTDELERLGEAQRFTTRLLDRQPAASSGIKAPSVAPARSITPH